MPTCKHILLLCIENQGMNICNPKLNENILAPPRTRNLSTKRQQNVYSQVSINVTGWEWLNNNISRIITSNTYRMNIDD